MALVPKRTELDHWRSLHRSFDEFDRHFGLGLARDDLVVPSRYSLLDRASPSWVDPYLRPWHLLDSELRNGWSNFKENKDGFEIKIDLHQFKPHEIIVKAYDNFVGVAAKHEERRLDGKTHVQREFVRRYALPSYVDPDWVKSTLSWDGILTINAPKTWRPSLTNYGRLIPVKRRYSALKDL